MRIIFTLTNSNVGLDLPFLLEMTCTPWPGGQCFEMMLLVDEENFWCKTVRLFEIESEEY